MTASPKKQVGAAGAGLPLAQDSGSRQQGSWKVELLACVIKDAFRVLGKADSAPLAKAVTRDRMRLLSHFPVDRQPTRGKLYGDIEYEKVPSETFFRVVFADDSYACGEITIFFSAHPTSPIDGKSQHAGTIVVLGLCKRKRESDKMNLDTIRNRHEHFVRKHR